MRRTSRPSGRHRQLPLLPLATCHAPTCSMQLQHAQLAGNVQNATCKIQRAEMQRATCRMQRATCRMQRAECRMQRAECNVQRTECNVQNATCRLQRATCRIQPTALAADCAQHLLRLAAGGICRLLHSLAAWRYRCALARMLCCARCSHVSDSAIAALAHSQKPCGLVHICTRAGLTPATAAPGLSSHLPIYTAARPGPLACLASPCRLRCCSRMYRVVPC